MTWLDPIFLYKMTLNYFSSPCCEDKECAANNTICVCQAITPVFRYCQCVGIAPVTLHSPTEDENENTTNFFYKHKHQCTTTINCSKVPVEVETSQCYISSRYISLPSVINVVFLIAFATVTTWVFFNIHKFLQVYFEGTDFYTFGTQVLFLYSHTVVILLNAFIQRSKIGKIWSLLIKVLKDLTRNLVSQPVTSNTVSVPPGHEMHTIATALLRNVDENQVSFRPIDHLDGSSQCKYNLHFNDTKYKSKSKLRHRLQLTRIFSYVVVAIVLLLSISHSISFVHLVFHTCFDNTTRSELGVVHEKGRLPCPLSDFFLFFQKLLYGVIDFVQQGTVILFSVLCLIIYVFFREVGDQLEGALKDACDIKSVGVERHHHIEKLRISYEDLSHCCRLMSECFGFAILAVLITSVISITCAIYSITLYSGVIDKEETLKVTRFYVIWAFHGWFGFFSLFLILIPGQMITNVSEAPSQVIGHCALVHLDKETKYQLSQFQHQSRKRVILTACNVTNVGLGFIAAVATNVTTYILVILQFRLGVEK